MHHHDAEAGATSISKKKTVTSLGSYYTIHMALWVLLFMQHGYTFPTSMSYARGRMSYARDVLC